jgi:zinc protease
MRATLFSLWISVSLLLTAGGARGEPEGRVRREVLPNGLRVVLVERPHASDVSVAVRYDAGRRDVPTGLSGLASIAARLLSDGTRHMAHGESERLLEAAGASSFACFTKTDNIGCDETVPPGALELALWMESERMGFPLDGVDAAAFEHEKSAFVEARRKEMHRPLASLDRFTADALWPAWHPYHLARTATEGVDVKLADVRAYVTTWLAPHNATIAVVGNFDASRALATITRLFGPIPDRPTPTRPTLPAFEPPVVARTYVGARNVYPAVRLAWVTPALGAPGDAELDFIGSIAVRHLRRVFVERGELRSVDAMQDSFASASVFSIDVTGQAQQRPEDILAAIDVELGRLPLDGPALSRARAVWQTNGLLGLEPTVGLARRLADHPGAAHPASPLDAAHARVTIASLAEAMRRWLPASRRAEIMVRKIYDQPEEGAEIGPLVGERRPGDRR